MIKNDLKSSPGGINNHRRPAVDGGTPTPFVVIALQHKDPSTTTLAAGEAILHGMKFGPRKQTVRRLQDCTQESDYEISMTKQGEKALGSRSSSI